MVAQTMKKIIPVQRPYLDKKELAAVSKVFKSRWLGMGALTKEFEEKLKNYLGVKHVVAVNTGTSALHIALASLRLEPGDEVIVPSLTFIASVQAILMVGAKPVYCEVSEDTLNIDIKDLQAKITKKTKVIMPVHYGGTVCDMDSLMKIALKHKLTIVEDASHAFGSTYHGKKVGSFGHLTCFSFDPIKNITCGEGGAVATNNEKLAELIRTKRILGINNDTWSRYKRERNWFYNVTELGFRYHMSDINAAIGLEQLKRISQFKSKKMKILKHYDKAFKNTKGLKLIDHDYDELFPFFYIIRVLDHKRDHLMSFLKERGIITGVHYIPNHLHPFIKPSHKKLPVTDQLYEEILTLPLFVEMTSGQVKRVVDSINLFLRKN